MGKRIELREGQVFFKGGKIRRIVSIAHAYPMKKTDRGAQLSFDVSDPPMHLFYTSGGDKTYRCQRPQFLRWISGADDITGATIEVEGSLV